MKAKNIVGKIYVSPMPIKGILKHFIEAFKLQFVCLIGGRVFNPRQQQVAYSRLVTISRCSSLLLPRVKNPPPN